MPNFKLVMTILIVVVLAEAFGVLDILRGFVSGIKPVTK